MVERVHDCAANSQLFKMWLLIHFFLAMAVLRLSSVLLSLGVVVLVSACAVEPPRATTLPSSAVALLDVDWVAVSIADVPAVAQPLPHVRWISSERVTGTGGCNSFMAQAKVDHGAVQFQYMVPRGGACLALPEGGQEDRFFKVLESARVLRLVNGQLWLEDASTRVLARFDKSTR